MNCKNCNNKLANDAKFCPECLKRYMPEPIKVKMKLVTKSNFPDRYVCPECGYDKLAQNKNMKIWFLKYTIKNPLFWASILLLILMGVACYIFRNKETVLAAISTGLVVIFGYFATHYFTVLRNQKEKKFQLYLEFIKKLRFFIIESDIKGSPQQCKIRDELQDAYFSFSLVISSASYEALSKMMKAFNGHLACKEQCKCNFKEEQSNFVNELRNEFFIDRKINFETYDIRLEQDNPQKI